MILFYAPTLEDLHIGFYGFIDPDIQARTDWSLLGRFTNLKFLKCSNVRSRELNQLYSAMKELKDLQTIDFCDMSSVAARTLTDWGELWPGLQSLSFCWRDQADTLRHSMDSFRHLTQLTVSGYQFGSALASHSSLKNLTIEVLKPDAINLQETLANMSNLESITIYFTTREYLPCPAFPSLPKLQEIKLHGAKLDIEFFASLEGLSNLRMFTAAGCKVEPKDGLKSISRLRNLENLALFQPGMGKPSEYIVEGCEARLKYLKTVVDGFHDVGGSETTTEIDSASMIEEEKVLMKERLPVLRNMALYTTDDV